MYSSKAILKSISPNQKHSYHHKLTCYRKNAREKAHEALVDKFIVISATFSYWLDFSSCHLMIKTQRVVSFAFFANLRFHRKVSFMLAKVRVPLLFVFRYFAISDFFSRNRVAILQLLAEKAFCEPQIFQYYASYRRHFLKKKH